MLLRSQTAKLTSKKIVTSAGRFIRFGRHDFGRTTYQIKRLVGRSDRIVQSFWHNTAYRSDADFSIGVSTKVSRLPYPSCPTDFWKDDIPRSQSDVIIQTDQYFSTFHATGVESFAACYFEANSDDDKTEKVCLGIRFSGKVLGQWRNDRKILYVDEPAKWRLINRDNGVKSYVALVQLDDETGQHAVPIKGILEWWTSSTRDKVIAFLPA